MLDVTKRLLVAVVSLALVFPAVGLPVTGSARAEDDMPARGNTGSMTFTLDAGPYTITKDEDGLDIIHMEDFLSTSSPGDPVLAHKVYNIAVPPDIVWSSLKLDIVSAETTVLEGTYDIKPAPPYMTMADEAIEYWGEGKDIIDGRNMNIYGTDADFPESYLNLLPYSQMRKWKFTRVDFSPFQYNPVSQKLTLTQSLSIEISYEQSGAKLSASLMNDTVMDDVARQMFLNYQQAEAMYQPQAMVQVERRAGDGGPTYDYVIITTVATQANSAELAGFITHKGSQGHSVLVVTEDEWGIVTGQAPDTEADRIRQWLMDNYASMGIEYVLLIGNPRPCETTQTDGGPGDVPMKTCYVYDPPTPQAFVVPTDYYYADLTGNWDVDGDEFFGEWSDNGVDNDYPVDGGVDLYPEVYVGRIPVYDAAYGTLDDILQKIVDYETASDTAWRKSALLPMSFLHADSDGARLAEQMKADYLVAAGFPSWTIYQQGNGACGLGPTYVSDEELRGGTREDVRVVVDCWAANPCGIVCWAGHGSPYAVDVGYPGCWDNDPCGDSSFIDSRSTDLSHLNDSRPAFTYQWSCQTGEPERNKNLQYSILKHGGIGTVGATRAVVSANPVQFAGSGTAGGIGYEHVKRLVAGNPAGMALCLAKAVVVPDVGGGHLGSMYAFNLYGDPSTSIERAEWREWRPMASGTTDDLQAVWGSASNDVFAVGRNGRILHYDGSSWSDMSSGTSEWLHGVWGNSPSDVFAVGDDGTVLHYDGNDVDNGTWTAMTSNTQRDLWGVWGSASVGTGGKADDVFAVGNGGTILHYDGNDVDNGTWTAMTSGTTRALRAVWGSSSVNPVTGLANDIFVVDCSEMYHYDGSTWTEMTNGLTVQFGFWGLWGSSSMDAPGYNKLVGADESASSDSHNTYKNNLHLAKFVAEATGSITTIRLNAAGHVNVKVGIYEDSSGQPGTLLSSVASTPVAPGWNDIPIDPTFVTAGKPYWLAFNSDYALRVCYSLTEGVFRYADLTYSQDFPGDLSGMTSVGPDNVLLHLAGWGTVQPVANDVYTVGDHGMVYYYDGNDVDNGTWVQVPPWATGNDRWGVWGSSSLNPATGLANDIFLVGESGEILHYRGGTWSTMASGTSNVLYDVWGFDDLTTGLANDVFVVGAGGTILRRQYAPAGPEIATSVTNVTETSATLNGILTHDGGEARQCRFTWGQSEGGPYPDQTAWTASTTTGQSFSEDISALNAGTQYFFVAQTTVDGGSTVTSGSEQSFTTRPYAPASFDAQAGSDGIDLTWTKGTGAQKTKIRRATGTYPTTPSAGDPVYFGAESNYSDTGLSGGTHYYYSAWSWVEGSDVWSSICVTAEATSPVLPPMVVSDYSSFWSHTSATLYGNITYTGGEDCDERGFVWGTVSHTGDLGNVPPTPTGSGYGNCWTNTTGSPFVPGDFYRDISGLSPGTDYYWRAWAHNSAGWGYGDELAFQTPAAYPTVDTLPATLVQETSATLNGEITATGGPDCNCIGFIWDTYSFSDPGDVEPWNLSCGYSYTSGTYGAETFDHAIASGTLTTGQKYYYRACAHNSAGWAYGDLESFVPSVGLGEAVDNTGLTWTTGGHADWFGQTATFHHDGDAAQSGDIADNQSTYVQTTVTGPGTLTFYWKVSSQDCWGFCDGLVFKINSAQQATLDGAVNWNQQTYTVGSGIHTLEWRYQKNASVDGGDDCGWLDQVEFTTVTINPPTVVTSYSYAIQSERARLKGQTTDTNGQNCDQRGFVWDRTSQDPPGNVAPTPTDSGYDDCRIEGAPGMYVFTTVSFRDWATGLTPATRYHWRACAHNSAGWDYGEEKTFFTKPAAPSNLDAAAPSNSQVDLSWTPGEGAQKTVIRSSHEDGASQSAMSSGSSQSPMSGSSSWSSMISGTSATLYAVWATSNTDAFAVGQGGTILHYDGTSWSSMTSGTTSDLRAVWASASEDAGGNANDVFAMDVSGTILHYDGTSWNSTDSGGPSLYGVWGNSSTDVFAVGSDGTILHYDGTSWSSMDSGIANMLRGVWGSSGSDVFTVGVSGTILHYGDSDNGTWTEMSSGTTSLLHSVWGSSDSDVFAVGGWGTVLHYDGTSWSSMTSGTTNPLIGVWGSSQGDVFAVGDNGTIIHYDGTSWSSMTSGTTNYLQDVQGSPGGDVFAVGVSGTILHNITYPSSPDAGDEVYFDAGTTRSDTGLLPNTTYYYSAWSWVEGSDVWSDTCVTVQATTQGSLPGDADGDGEVNVLDMTKVARIILLWDAETPGADANLDGEVNVLDMTKIARIILGLD